MFDQARNEVVLELGLKAKYLEIASGMPCPFLGRYFIPGASFADPMRVVQKLHITFVSADSELALADKAAGYFVTDSKTPIIGPWVERVLSVCRRRGIITKMSAMTSDE
ncbi:hypothetical protein GJ496_005106 [Pomphorhynchus laevis]|nr:hypothetical protein GJ496_005106 [Pomphorhynchus laevis]